MYSSSMSRQDFIGSRFLTIKLIDLEKSLLHRNKFVFEIVTDRSTELCRKNYGELKRFTTELVGKQGMQELTIEHHMRSSQQKRELEVLFKKLNNGYLMTKEGESETHSEKRLLIRNYLFNLFYNSLESPLSDEDEEAPSRPMSEPELTQISENHSIVRSSFQNELLEELRKEEKKEKREEEGKEKKDEGKEKREGRREEGKAHYISKIKTLYRSKAWKEEERRELLMRGIDQIWLRQGEEWVLKKLSIENNLLIFWDGSLKTVVLLKKYDIIIAEEHYRRIQLSHPLLAAPLELRLRAPHEAHLDHTDLEDYVKLLTLLKETTMSLNGYNEEVVNFLTIRICNKKNKFSQDNEKRPAKELVLRMVQEGETIELGMPIDSAVNLLLPVTNHYGKLECEVVEGREAGLIPNFREYSIQFVLPVQNIYDQLFNEKPKRKSHEMRYFILGSKLCNYSLKIDFKERGNRWTYCSMRPNDRFEGEKPPTEFSREEFRIQKNRFKRIVFYLEGIVHHVSALKNMEHPFQSYLFYLLLLLTTLLFNPDYLLHYFLGLLAILLLYYHPNSTSYFRELISLFGLQSWAARMEQRMKERSWAKSRVRFLKEMERRRFLQQFKFTRKRQGSIVQKYQRLHLWLLRGQLVLTELVTLSEKVKNLFLWYHHRKTKELLLLVLAVLAVLLFVPVRLILLGALWRMFRKGLANRLRVQEINKVILFQILQNLVEEFGLIEAKGWLLEPGKPYDRKHSDYIALQRRLKEWLSMHLLVEADPQVFQDSRCMNDLITVLADCRKRLVIPEAICRKYKFNLEWSQEKSGVGKVLLLIYGFILSSPSDRNILGIAYEEPDKEGQFDSDDLEEP